MHYYIPRKTLWCKNHEIRAVENSAGIFKQSVGVRNRVGIGLSYRSARLKRLAELIPCLAYSLESILGLLKSLKIRAQYCNVPVTGCGDTIAFSLCPGMERYGGYP
jgi:hypothetical protein